MGSPPKPHQRARGVDFERQLADALRRAGWVVVRQPGSVGSRRPDLLVHRGEAVYAVELKSAPEGRSDRLVPLLSQAIIQADAAAKAIPAAAPLAVIAAPRIPDRVAEQLRRFVSEFAPHVAIGIMDLEGLRAFSGAGLEAINAPRARADRMPPLARPEASQHLFSDLHQWMLKVLLAARIPDALLRAPRGQYRNASELAAASNVSVMSAFRFVRQLRQEGFLDESADRLRLVRVESLMQRWQAAYLAPARELPMRWILRGDGPRQLYDALRSYAKRLNSSVAPADAAQVHSRGVAAPRMCLGLFAAADVLGVGFVHGAPPHLYLEEPDRAVVRQLGLGPAEPGRPVDVYLRIPRAREAVFRAAVEREGLPSCDVIQVWLDVADHPARGREQAAEIRRRVLRPLFEEKKR